MSQVPAIAWWEFRRWYKLKDQLTTIVVSVCAAGVMWLVGRIFADDDEPVTLAVIGAEHGEPATLGRFTLVPATEPREELVAQPSADMRDGVLELLPERARLHCAQAPDWLGELREALERERLERRLDELELHPEEQARLFAPLELEVVAVDGEHELSGPAKWTALAVVGLAVLAVFVGMSYQFVAITGEKQARVTELMLSAVTPQAWMDGKILGLSLLSAACLGTYVLSSAAFLVAARILGMEIPLALEFAASLDLVWVVLLALGGFAFWNTLFAAIAATINDPYTSSRGSLIMLPGISLVLGIFALLSPDRPWELFCALFPPTSWTVMPVRLVLGDPPLWEVLLALALLWGSVVFLRNAAGRIFRASVLMYGKEPSWGEMRAWVRGGAPREG